MRYHNILCFRWWWGTADWKKALLCCVIALFKTPSWNATRSDMFCEAEWRALWEMQEISKCGKSSACTSQNLRQQVSPSDFFFRVFYVGVQFCSSYTSHWRCFSSLSVSHHCQNTSDLSRPYQPSLRSEALLCVTLTLNPVSIHQCLLLAAQTGFSTEAMGAHDYTLACSCPPGTSSLRTSAAVNTPGMYCDRWLNKAFK